MLRRLLLQPNRPRSMPSSLLSSIDPRGGGSLALFATAAVCTFGAAAAASRVQRSVRQRRASQAMKAKLSTAASDASRPKKSSLYTRTGDAGESSLYNNERRPKDDLVFEALGTVDELHAHVGLAAEYCEAADNGLQEKLREVQSRLIDLGACVGTPRTGDDADRKVIRTAFDAAHVETLERATDEVDGRLPPLKTFILAGGGLAASHLHVARTVCRRAERAVVPLVARGSTDETVTKYLNRLSDLLFACARYACEFEGRAEVTYRPGKR